MYLKQSWRTQCTCDKYVFRIRIVHGGSKPTPYPKPLHWFLRMNEDFTNMGDDPLLRERRSSFSGLRVPLRDRSNSVSQRSSTQSELFFDMTLIFSLQVHRAKHAPHLPTATPTRCWLFRICSCSRSRRLEWPIWRYSTPCSGMPGWASLSSTRALTQAPAFQPPSMGPRTTL